MKMFLLPGLVGTNRTVMLRVHVPSGYEGDIQYLGVAVRFQKPFDIRGHYDFKGELKGK